MEQVCQAQQHIHTLIPESVSD